MPRSPNNPRRPPLNKEAGAVPYVCVLLPRPRAATAVASTMLLATVGGFLVCMEGQFVLKGVIRWILLARFHF